MDQPHAVNDFISRLFPPFTGEPLFDQLPDIVYFIKNRCGEYVVVNSTLVERCGLRNKLQLIGRTPSQVLRPPLGLSFEAQDRYVIQTGQPLLSKLELHIYPSRDVGWCLTHKLPLRDRAGTVVGLVGVSQDLRVPDPSSEAFRHVSIAVSYAKDHLASPPSVKELAELAEMSPYQLDRRMRHVFGLTTGQWLLKQRIDRAQWLLQFSDDAVSSIAIQAGYADQSAFTRQFRKATGLSPSDYRTITRQQSGSETGSKR